MQQLCSASGEAGAAPCWRSCRRSCIARAAEVSLLHAETRPGSHEHGGGLQWWRAKVGSEWRRRWLGARAGLPLGSARVVCSSKLCCMWPSVPRTPLLHVAISATHTCAACGHQCHAHLCCMWPSVPRTPVLNVAISAAHTCGGVTLDSHVRHPTDATSATFQLPLLA